MVLSQIKYSVVVSVQLSLLLCDLAINAFGEKLRYNSGLLLLLCIVQDGLQVLALTILFISIFQTNVFQAGFIELLYERFRWSIFAAMAYLLLTVFFQCWSLTVRWDNPLEYNWPPGMVFLYSLQRSASFLHYFLYKQSVLCLTDPRLYDDNWISQRLNNAR